MDSLKFSYFERNFKNSIKMSRDYHFMVSRDFMHFGSCHFKLIIEQTMILNLKKGTHFLHLLPFFKTNKTGTFVNMQRANRLRPFNQYEVHPHIAHLTNLHVYDILWCIHSPSTTLFASPVKQLNMYIIHSISTSYFSRV